MGRKILWMSVARIRSAVDPGQNEFLRLNVKMPIHKGLRSPTPALAPAFPNPESMPTQLTEEPMKGAKGRAGKYLTFSIHRESYGIDVLHVREIIRVTEITALPEMPDYIRGVINLRGKIIPVLDLRVRFGFPEAKDTEQTCIVVVLVRLPDGKASHTGLVVDNVEEVINVAASEIEETPEFGADCFTRCVLGIATVKGAIKTLLDIDCVLAAGGHEALSAAFRCRPADPTDKKPTL